MHDPTDLIRRSDAIAWCDKWIATFGAVEIRHTSAREYALDAVKDLRDALHSIPAHPVQEPPSHFVTGMSVVGVEPLGADFEAAIFSDVESLYEADPPSPGVTAGATWTEATEIDRIWQDLLDKSDRTSPEDHPDMALITRDELSAYMRASLFGPYAWLVKPEGAAEDEWYLDCNPSDFDDHVSVPLFALEDQRRVSIDDSHAVRFSADLATPAPVVPAEGLAEVADALDEWADVLRDGRQIDGSVVGLRQMARIVRPALRSAPPVGARVSIPPGLIDALRSQRQIDADGCEVAVSRQACDEAAAILAALLPAGEGE